MMQTNVRPEDASPPPSTEPAAPEREPVTAGSFRELVTVAEETVRDDALAAKQLAAHERLRQIKAMLLEHLDKEAWATLLDRAQAAAAEGESAFELIRFPCDLCSDGGRKIGVAENDWPTTLRGEAAEVYARWERELRPTGFRLRAQIVEYLDGIPNTIALSLAWPAPESAKRIMPLEPVSETSGQRTVSVWFPHRHHSGAGSLRQCLRAADGTGGRRAATRMRKVRARRPVGSAALSRASKR